jgi:hypothetical protein
MDLLGGYSDSDDEVRMPSGSSMVVVDVAPAVNTAGLTIVRDENGGALVLPLAQTSQYIGASDTRVHHLQTGPQHPPGEWQGAQTLMRSRATGQVLPWTVLE